MNLRDALNVMMRDRERGWPGREKVFEDMLACFHAYNIRVLGSMHGALLVRNETWPYGDIWLVSDNGGELNIEKVNDHKSLRSMPYTWFDLLLDGATMAWRVRCVLDGDAVDFMVRHDDVLDVIREPVGTSAHAVPS